MASGRRQFIFSADLSGSDLTKYKETVSKTKAVTMIRNTNPLLLDDLQDGSSFAVEVFFADGRFAIKYSIVQSLTPQAATPMF